MLCVAGGSSQKSRSVTIFVLINVGVHFFNEQVINQRSTFIIFLRFPFLRKIYRDNFCENRFPKQPDDKLLPIKQPQADTFFILSLTGTLMRFRVRVIANNKHDFSYAVSGDVWNNCKKIKNNDNNDNKENENYTTMRRGYFTETSLTNTRIVF